MLLVLNDGLICKYGRIERPEFRNSEKQSSFSSILNVSMTSLNSVNSFLDTVIPFTMHGTDREHTDEGKNGPFILCKSLHSRKSFVLGELSFARMPSRQFEGEQNSLL